MLLSNISISSSSKFLSWSCVAVVTRNSSSWSARTYRVPWRSKTLSVGILSHRRKHRVRTTRAAVVTPVLATDPTVWCVSVYCPVRFLFVSLRYPRVGLQAWSRTLRKNWSPKCLARTAVAAPTTCLTFGRTATETSNSPVTTSAGHQFCVTKLYSSSDAYASLQKHRNFSVPGEANKPIWWTCSKARSDKG